MQRMNFEIIIWSRRAVILRMLKDYTCGETLGLTLHLHFRWMANSTVYIKLGSFKLKRPVLMQKPKISGLKAHFTFLYSRGGQWGIPAKKLFA